MYQNIEKFYQTNQGRLLHGDLAPAVSFNKDAESYISKLAAYCESNRFPKEITVGDIESCLAVSRGSNVATVECPLTWIQLGIVEDTHNTNNQKDVNHKYSITDDFILMAKNKMVPGVYILHKILDIDSISKMTKFLNLLICTLREGYLKGYIIDFPRDNGEYTKTVTNVADKITFNERIKTIYGHDRGVDNSPYISMRAINNLKNLGLIHNDGVAKYNFPKYSLTPNAHKLLSILDYNFSLQNGSKYIITSLQQIWYGAPGTGKSHEIKEQTDGKAVVRTTFHPDSDYSTFVGAYKPVMDEVDVKVTPVVTTGGVSFSPASDMKEKRISYRFVKQAFMKAYLGAWKKYADNPQNPDPQYLVIEEINRGNCAQIFGDIFQLLDRSDKGFSEYPIEADEDLRQEIARSFAVEVDYKLSADLAVDGVVENYTSNYGATLSEDIQQGRVMLLPSNLYIWATMNTSDQSLFPIDSAFKRRWEWKYMPIKDCIEGFKIVLGNGKEYDWYEFISKMNGLIAEKTDSEDKQMGYFFIKAEGGKITADRFVNKVLFYLYNDVFKSYDLPTQFGNKKFTAFFTDTDTKVEELMKGLGLEALGESDTAETTEDTAE